MVVTTATAVGPLSLSLPVRRKSHFLSPPSPRSSSSSLSLVSALPAPYSDLSRASLVSSSAYRLPPRIYDKDPRGADQSHRTIKSMGNPPIMPAVMTPAGPTGLSTVIFRNRIVFVGQPINAEVAQSTISQLVTLAAIDENADILMYLNSPGGNTYSVLAIYDCMSWIKPKVATVGIGIVASESALLLAGGEKGMRYSMPNTRIMLHQTQGGCWGHVDDVRIQVNEAVESRHKLDRMYAAFTGQPLEIVQQTTDRNQFFSAAEALEFGLIDELIETEY